MDLTALRDLAANLGGQTSVVGGQLYTEAEVDESLNGAGEELWLEAKQFNNGWGEKDVIDDTVVGVSDIPLPADFDHRVIKVQFANEGVDFNVTPPAQNNHLLLEPAPSNYGPQREHDLAFFDGTEFYSFHFVSNASPGVATLRLIGPPGSTRTGAVQTRYAAGYTPLVSPTDVPELPLSHHRLIAYKAGATLRGTAELEWPLVLDRTLQSRQNSFDKDMVEMVLDLEHRAPTAGLRRSSSSIKTGFVRRRTARGTRDRF